MAELPDDLLLAIGRLVSSWSMVEMSLAGQVGRLAAAEPDIDARKMRYHPQAYVYTTSIAMGCNARAKLGQIENLAFGKAERVRKVAETIMDIKEKRDRIAHLPPMRLGDQLIFHGKLNASKRQMGANYPYTAKQIHLWVEQLKLANQEIDKIVTEYTQVSWSELGELNEQ